MKAAGRRDAPASAARSGDPAERNGLPSLASGASPSSSSEARRVVHSRSPASTSMATRTAKGAATGASQTGTRIYWSRGHCWCSTPICSRFQNAVTLNLGCLHGRTALLRPGVSPKSIIIAVPSSFSPLFPMGHFCSAALPNPQWPNRVISGLRGPLFSKPDIQREKRKVHYSPFSDVNVGSRTRTGLLLSVNLGRLLGTASDPLPRRTEGVHANRRQCGGRHMRSQWSGVLAEFG
jgi:hypothetical protein